MASAPGGAARIAAGRGPADVVGAVLDRVVAGDLLPGDRLVAAELARELRLPPEMVVDGFDELESMEVVVVSQSAGVRLADVGTTRLRKMLKVRLLLEKLAAAELRAATAEGDEVFQPLEDIVGRMREAAARQDRPALARLDLAFHRTLCELSGNEALVRAWSQLSGQLTVVLSIVVVRRPPSVIVDSHVELLDNLRFCDCSARLDRILDLHVLDGLLAMNLQDFAARLRRQRAALPA
ncbi:MAG TPA: FCD domain-containing protein [Geminicoccaceae bacterium]|nr:FCD domain-containing protein [Geminicoccus sp.]HMU51493.1 FCD domain-containing protein [Geminicoccaceae bacterium]